MTQATTGEGPAPAGDVRVALIDANLGWARKIAKRIYLRVHYVGLEWDDYVGAATIGLIEAVDRFDPDNGACFQSFAIHRVRGEVFNAIKAFARGGLVAREAPVTERMASLCDDESRSPVERVLDLVSGLSIGYLLDMASMPSESAGSCAAYGAAEAAQTEQALARAVQALPERERLIISLHYFQHVPFTEIAMRFGLTKGRISQLHRRAIAWLRLSLRGEVVDHAEESFGESAALERRSTAASTDTMAGRTAGPQP